jgi:hypothetical protein
MSMTILYFEYSSFFVWKTPIFSISRLLHTAHNSNEATLFQKFQKDIYTLYLLKMNFSFTTTTMIVSVLVCMMMLLSVAPIVVVDAKKESVQSGSGGSGGGSNGSSNNRNNNSQASYNNAMSATSNTASYNNAQSNSGGDGSTLDFRTIPVLCDICYGGSTNSGSVQVDAGKVWTCKYLQETVQDVNTNGWSGEQRMCANARLLAKQCPCSGGNRPADVVHNVNDSCNLCGAYGGVTPASVGTAGITVNTGVVGNMNCGGLYNAMAGGIISSNLCPIVKSAAGPTCCTRQSTYSWAQGRSASTTTSAMLRGSAMP